jgi:Winged helix domain, variant
VTTDQTTWTDANQRYLAAGLARIHAALERQRARVDDVPAPATEDVEPYWPDDEGVPALEALCRTFGLSSFERDTLLLCAGAELEATFAPLCAAAQGDPARPYPTFSLALAVLDEPSWSALTPDAPLRHWRMIEIAQQPGAPLTTSPLRIDERILHFLTGLQHLDERLVGLVEPIWPESELVASHLALAQRIGAAWSRAGDPLPLIQLCGADETSKRDIAATGCAALGLRLFCLHADSIPANTGEFEGLARLW